MTVDIPSWLGVFIAIASLVYTIYSQRQKAAAHKVAEIENGVAELKNRVTRLESDMKHLPDLGTTHRLELSMTEMKAELGVIAERIKPIAAVSGRLQEMILEMAERSGRI